MFGLPLPLVLLTRTPWSVPVMASKVIPWYKKKHVSQVKTDYAYHHTKHVSKQHTERYDSDIYLLLWVAQLLLLCDVEQKTHTGVLLRSSCASGCVCFLAGSFKVLQILIFMNKPASHRVVHANWLNTQMLVLFIVFHRNIFSSHFIIASVCFFVNPQSITSDSKPLCLCELQNLWELNPSRDFRKCYCFCCSAASANRSYSSGQWKTRMHLSLLL